MRIANVIYGDKTSVVSMSSYVWVGIRRFVILCPCDPLPKYRSICFPLSRYIQIGHIPYP